MDEVKPAARLPTVEHREPCESRGSRTVLGAPGGEIPPGDSSIATNLSLAPDISFWGEADLGRAAEFAASVENGPKGDIAGSFSASGYPEDENAVN